MAHTKTIIKEEINDENSPGVIAYRVGQLEKTQHEGFTGLSDKLDEMTNNFATHAALENAKRESELEHINIRTEIHEVKQNTDRNSRDLRRAAWTILTIVIVAVLAVVGLKAGVGGL